MDFEQQKKQKTEEINELLRRYLPKEEGEERILCEAMNYSIAVGGKRIRPMLLLEAYAMFGGTGDAAEPFAAALEMIHTYSLVHDDLPAMDNDRYRRGQLTTHAKFGEAIGILAGDGLLNYAFEVMSDAVCEQGENAAKAMRILSNKAGIRGMIAGQTVDLTWTGKALTRELLDYINERKTSALLSGALMAGAALAGAEEEELSVLCKVGNYVGLAFQIKDDILDVTGDEKKLGKPLHSDEKNDKTTYVTLIGIEKAEEVVKEYSECAVKLLDTLPYRNTFLKELLLSLAGREY
ncbi:MAG: polyprenyl synthetase family protein [Lachnospiraceae bacterium]|nr:polyprenyl synthetase family protein [Lachnospiraceae bacterium]